SAAADSATGDPPVTDNPMSTVRAVTISRMRPAYLIVALALAVRCATAPTQTAGQAALARNARAVVSGRLVDTSGYPVANMRVDPIPMARRVTHPDPTRTDPDGPFELS